MVGQAPIEYVTGWRMQIAADRIRNSQASLAAIAADVGYESEAAFSNNPRTAFNFFVALKERQDRPHLFADLRGRPHERPRSRRRGSSSATLSARSA